MSVDLISKLSEWHGKLTELNANSILEKVRSFDAALDKGYVHLEVALEDLEVALSILKNALDSDVLAKLPKDTLRQIEKNMSSLYPGLLSLETKPEAYDTIVQYIETLRYLTWVFRLDEELWKEIDVQHKLGELLKYDSKLQRTLKKADKIDIADSKVADALRAVINSEATANNALGVLLQHAAEISAKRDAYDDLIAKSQAKFENVEQMSASISELYEKRIELEKKVEDIKAEMPRFYKAQELDINKLKSEVSELISDAKEALRFSTAVRLFHVFGERKEQLQKTSLKWLIAIAVTVILGGVVVWLVTNQLVEALKQGGNISTLIYIKTSILGLVAFSLWFCTRQYGHERKLVEEYAFKATTSTSLEAYRELIVKMVQQCPQNERGKSHEHYIRSIIGMIERIFTSPYVSLKKSEKEAEDEMMESAQRIAGIVGTAAGTVKNTQK